MYYEMVDDMLYEPMRQVVQVTNSRAIQGRGMVSDFNGATRDLDVNNATFTSPDFRTERTNTHAP